MTLLRLIIVVLVVLRATTSSGQIIIDFEKRPDGSVPVAGEVIGNSYSALGVNFRSISSNDLADPWFSHFPQHPDTLVARDLQRDARTDQPFNVVAEFSNPVTSVSVDAFAHRDAFLSMTARDSNGAIIGTVNSPASASFAKGRISLSNIGLIKSVEWVTSEPIIGTPGIDNLIFTPQISRLESRLPPQKPGARNFTGVFHGWQGGESTWAPQMGDAITDHVREQQNLNEVVVYNWRDLSDGPRISFDDALLNANGLGFVEGQIIGNRRYDHVHLIGHSAAAGLISSAARQIKRVSNSTSVHTTFLDAYAPNITGLLYGTASDWSDHYFNHGDSGWLDWTESTFRNSHNVNVTGLDPTPTPLRPDLGHAWPHEFYLESITRDDPYALGYGFKLSREGGRWNPSNYPAGNDPVLLYAVPIPEPPKQVLGITTHTVSFGGGKLTTSETGAVNVVANSFSLETGSPVWFIQDVNVSEPASFLTFDLDFTSEAGSEGMLSVFLDNHLIGRVDERFVLEDVQTEHLSFSEIQPGFHKLAFRLDPFTETQSSVKIDNVVLGSVRVIPEPKSIVLLLLGILIFTNYLRRR